MSEDMHINVNFTAKYEAQLKGIWKDIDNEAGSEGVIDKKEEAQNVSSIYFVEEGMTEAQFVEKNLDVAYSEMLALPSDYNGTKTQYAVSQIVNEMLDKIDSGELDFEAKKDVILGKMKFLDEETKHRVNSFIHSGAYDKEKVTIGSAQDLEEILRNSVGNNDAQILEKVIMYSVKNNDSNSLNKFMGMLLNLDNYDLRQMLQSLQSNLSPEELDKLKQMLGDLGLKINW